MFVNLRVKNFALIEDVEIDFRKGFTAFVGETGAGKSLLVDAIHILSGARSSVSFVKNGTDFAEVSGTFFLPEHHVVYKILEKNDIEIITGEDIFVSRRITKEGRTICKIQGVQVSATLLKQLMNKLIDIHGQHESSYLFDEKNHLALVDVFAQNKDELHAYQLLFKEFQLLEEKKSSLKKLAEDVENLPIYRADLDTIINAQVGMDELQTLQQQFQDLKSFEQQFSIIQQAYSLLENTAFIDELSEINKKFEHNNAPATSDLTGRLSSVYFELDDLRLSFGEKMHELNEQASEHDRIEARIAEIFNLQKKFGEDLALAQVSLKEKIDQIENLEYEMIQLDKEILMKQQQLTEHAEHLSINRKTAAQQLAEKIMIELKDVYLENVIFTVNITDCGYSMTGKDKVVFYIQTNVGDVSKPLSEIASGGELSRIMLAIKVVFAERQTLTTMIFDEIDTGVSGKVAQAIAQKMRVFSESLQVFAITHLPQVLAASDQQLQISKYVEEGATHVHVAYLSPEEHVQEVAKMLSGEQVHKAGLQHASELIQIFRKNMNKG